MWQDGNQTWTYFFLGYLLQLIFIDIYFVCQIIFVINADNLADFIEAFALLTTYLTLIFKCLNFFCKLKEIKKSLEFLTSVLNETSRQESGNYVKSQVKFVFKIYKMFWATAIFTCCSGAFVPIFSHKMPYKVWFPFSTSYGGVGFWLASYYLVFNSFVVSAIDMALDVLPCIFISFIVGMLEELSERLSTIKNQKELIKCIGIHKNLKKLVDDVEKNFSTTIFAQGLMSSVGALNSLSQATDLSIFLRITSFMVPMVLEIFLPCYFGNELSFASAKLSLGLFHPDWYNSSLNSRKIVIIFMENTKDLKISAFRVFDSNLATFTSIGNSAYSLFAVLKQVNRKV